MADRREDLLARLVEVARDVPGVVLAERNRPDLSERSRPAILIMDADETADERAYGRGRPPHAPNIVSLAPEILILLGSRHQDVGSLLNSLRGKLLKAILTDPELQRLVGANGEIRYEGCNTDLASGRAVEGAMLLNVVFAYVFNPSEF